MASTTAAMSCPKIMQRPAAAAAPTEVVCGTSNAVSAAATKEKENAPTILQNKGTFSPSTVILEKEDKREEPRIMIMKPGAGQAAAAMANDTSKSEPPSSPPSSPGNGAGDAAATADVDSKTASWNPLVEVDSALLSAMCDSRERKALFRLEQVIVDFMKDKSSGSMEVGGAFNSIVLNWNHGANSSNVEASGGQMSALYQQGLQDFHFQQQRGLRQTSFQRLILHRLADRFNIIREQINGNGGFVGLVDMGPGVQPLSFSPGLIRLVKTTESCIPSHLLIDIDLSLLINYKNPRARNYGGGNSNINANAASANSSNYEDGAVKNLTENMASSTLETPSAAATSSSSGSGKKSNKKMVIMKRNSSSGSGNLEGKGKGKQKGKSRRKKLEDREKAYEEARARIFGISESPGNETNDGRGDDNVEKGERPSSVPQSADSQDVGATPLNSCHSSFSVENDVASSSGGVAEHVVPLQPLSAAPSADRSSPPSPDPQKGEKGSASASPARAASASEAEALRQSSSFSTSSVPAAVTSGAVFKAVYRNRQQEENDPDFKRRSDVRPSYVPYVSANPYGGYGVNPAAMGQQPPVPAAMMAMHVQQQQQAAGHQPHFYHAPAPNQQFPTPQDAVAAAYPLNPTVGSSPPAQWAAALPRGYYPPPQQQGQQEKHLQAWQPRSNNASQMQQPNSGPNSGNNNHGAHFNAPANNAMNNSQTRQLNKVLWGPGAQGDAGSPDTMSVSRTAEGATSSGGKGDAAVYKPEDFPALG